MPASPPEPTAGKKAIAVVEDHPLMRRGLTVLIDAESDLFVCAEATTCRGALREIARRPPDLAIVDLVLEGGDDGLDLVKALKIEYPALPTLVFSMHPEGVYGERALRAGAHGYLTKQQVDGTLLAAIRRMLKGGIYMSEALAIDLATHFIVGRKGHEASPLAALSSRELQVFRLIGHGRRTREIAEILHLSAKTIETYREHLKQKLGLGAAPELLRRATRWVETGQTG